MNKGTSRETCRARRAKLMDAVGDGLIVVRGQGPEGGNASFAYLTGIVEPRATLVLAPRGARLVRGRAAPGCAPVRHDLDAGQRDRTGIAEQGDGDQRGDELDLHRRRPTPCLRRSREPNGRPTLPSPLIYRGY